MNAWYRIVVLIVLAAQLPALAGEVIAHAQMNLSADEIREVFLGEKQFAGSTRLVPIDNSAAQFEFLSKVMQTDAHTYAARWTKKSFREGLVAPKVGGSDAEVTAFVKATPGSIGYVNRNVDGVKVLHRY